MSAWRCPMEHDPRRCDRCGRKYIPKNVRSRYCSDRCRAAARRDRITAGRPVAPRNPREKAKLSEEREQARYESQVAGAVVRLRGCSHELSVLAAHKNDSGRSNICYRLAEGIMRLLESEGLA